MKINKDNYFKRLTGYKISDSHFELGSNLHINDYYYAKRLFYNSFYTNRFAFLITQYIIANFKVLIDEIHALGDELPAREKIITLMGFENYAELLISNVRKMLNDYYAGYFKKEGTELFNHDIYTKDAVFMKNPGKIGRNIISIFPISTTFSTSVKMQSEIREMLADDTYNNQVVFHDPIINCLVISNGEISGDVEFTDKCLENEFGWKSINYSERIIEMISLDDPSLVLQQKYFLNLPSAWKKINECNLCYPQDYAVEKCLIETKSNPVTPNLIFSYPKSFHYDEEGNAYDLFGNYGAEPIVYRKHFEKFNNNFIYYIRTGIFLKKNRAQIMGWLTEVGKGMSHLSEKNVVIITPALASNAGFANLVNDVIFSDTATIIQYNPTDDYLHNFKIFYASILEYADYILFADDILFTTKTFSDINYYIKNIQRANGKNGIDKCISLINRSGYYNYTKLKEELETENGNEYPHNKNIFSFADINVAPILHRKIYPFVKLTDKFKDLSSKSVLDEMRIHFRTKEKHFQPFDLTREFSDLNPYGTPKELFQFLTLNEFNKTFKFDDSSNKYAEELLIGSTFESDSPQSYHEITQRIAQSPAMASFLKAYPEYENEIKNGIFKICSSEPFIQFKSIRESVFRWVLYELIATIAQINQKEDIGSEFFEARKNKRPTKYTEYQNLKFLLKRGTKLKMNFIYSLDTLKAIEKILRGIKKYKSIKYYAMPGDASNAGSLLSLFEGSADPGNTGPEPEHIVSLDKPVFTSGFITYYIGLLQELIVEHESKALQTVINVKNIIDDQLLIFNTNLKNTYNNDYMKLLRMLVLENTFIFHSSSDKFLKRLKYSITLNDLKNGTSLKRFRDDLKIFAKTYSFGYTEKMLSRISFEQGITKFDSDTAMDESFENMILLKAAIRSDLHDNGTGNSYVRDKIETILDYCCRILDISGGGGFFAVKYKNKHIEETGEGDFAIVGEYCKNEENFLNTSGINKDSILYHVFNGIKETDSTKSLSSFEISVDSGSNCHFIKNDRIGAIGPDDFCEMENYGFSNLLYLRISQIEDVGDGKFKALPIAVLCFYDNIPRPKGYDVVRFDPKRVRQLLLLRNDLNDFITKQLDNDSLRAYIEEQNQIIINKAITHSFDTYINQYTDTLQEITDKDVRDKFDILGTLILNKHLLLRFIAEYLKCRSTEKAIEKLSITTKTMSGDELKEMIFLYQKIIFSMDLSEIDVIRDEQVTVSITMPAGIQIVWYDFFYKELIFEVLYNIRKNYGDYINADDKFQIDFRIATKGIQHYLSVTNNLYQDLPDSKRPIKQIERIMYNWKEKKGLSLLNTISEIIYDKKCLIRQFGEDKFQIEIPIEAYEQEITNS